MKVYAFYEALYATGRGLNNQLAGSLLLYDGLGGAIDERGDEPGRIAALAGNIAGLATLGISANTAALKQAVFDGVCDFLVNSLDEALRILKNEVRKKQPVSVCLHQDFATAIAEIVGRGVQPDLLALGDSATLPAVEVLRARGAVSVLHDEGQRIDGTHRVGVAWTALAAPQMWLPKIDAIAASVIAAADEPRQRWLRFGSRYLGRLTNGTHFLPMTPAEAALFRSVLQEKVDRGSIGCATQIAVDNEEFSAVVSAKK